MWYSKFKELIVRLIVKFIYTVIQSVETSFVFQWDLDNVIQKENPEVDQRLLCW